MRWSYVAPLALIDLCARLAVPASLLALARGHGEAAIAAAAAVNVLSIARGMLRGHATERVLRTLWTELVGATRRYDVAHLRSRDDMHSVPALLNALASRADFEATTVPQLLANATGLALALTVILLVLGLSWLGLGLLAVALAAPVVWFGHRHLRKAQTESFACFNAAALSFEVLLDGAAELRVHGVEDRHAGRLLTHIRAMAAAERRTKTTSVLMGLLPIGIALLVAVIPLREHLQNVTPTATRIADVGVLGATALALAFGLMRNLESYARTTPFRRTSKRFVALAPAARPPGKQLVNLAHDVLTMRDVGFAHASSQVSTPADVTATWSHDEGLALAGPNGAGKTTLALCLVGLLQPTEGRMQWGEVDVKDVDWTSLRKRIVYVPQHAFVAGNQSVAWHLRLLTHGELDDEALRLALVEVGLWSVLESRRDAVQPLDVPVSELSGGEQKRMHLARVLLDAPELVVLDEPEAGLDTESRQWLRGFVEQIAGDRRVVLIAHDDTVIPKRFRLLNCVRSQETAATEN